MSAYTIASSEYPMVVRRSRATASTDSPQPEAPPGWLTAGAMRAAGGGLILVAALLGVIYLTAAAAEMHRPGRTLLVAVATATAVVAGVLLVVSWALRIVDRQLARLRASLASEVAAGVVGPLHRLDALAELPEQVRARVATQGRVYATLLGQVEQRLSVLANVPSRDDLAELVTAVRELGDRVADVAASGSAVLGEGNADLLRGVAGWAAQLDHRLAEIQHGIPTPPNSTQGNGHRESPMELSDEALRGYFLGFYDRERGDADGTVSST